MRKSILGTVLAVPFFLPGRAHLITMHSKKFKFTTLMICRAGLIAALYAVVTWALGAFAYGPFQIRPAEGLVVLSVFYIEAVPGLYVGCMLANIFSGWGAYDIFLGSLATLAAAGLSFAAGRIFKSDVIKLIICGLLNTVINAFVIPAVSMLGGGTDPYWVFFGSMVLTQAVWSYAIGAPLYFAVRRLIGRRVRVMLPLVGAGQKSSAAKIK